MRWKSLKGLLCEEHTVYQELWSSLSNRVPKSYPIQSPNMVPHDEIQRRTSIHNYVKC